MGKKIGIAAGAILVGVPAAGIFLAEISIRIPPSFRVQPDLNQARALAQATGSSCREVEIRAQDGIPLRAWYFEPRSSHGAAVVLLHGLGDSRRGLLYHARFLLARGFPVLVPDNRGHGASGGSLFTYGVIERDDLARWSRWLLDSARAHGVHALGESMGAAIVLQSLAVQAPFRSVVAECSFSTFAAVAYERLAGHLPLPRPLARWAVAPFAETALFWVRVRYGHDLRQADPGAAIRSTRVPVLLIHGADDTSIQPYHSRVLREANAAHTSLWEAPGAAHTRALAKYPAEYERRVVEWFLRSGAGR